jgi:hypothetical protein
VYGTRESDGAYGGKSSLSTVFMAVKRTTGVCTGLGR